MNNSRFIKTLFVLIFHFLIANGSLWAADVANDTCRPPANLDISSQNLQNIVIRWNTPEMNPNQKTLSWSSEVVDSYFGYPTCDYQISMIQRFCASDLTDYHGQALTGIRFYAHEDATAFKAVVYKGGSYNGNYNPGELVLQQDIDISSLTLNSWNTVTLNTPVIINSTEELWFGIYVEAPMASCCLPLNSLAAPTKGCVYGFHSGNTALWGELSSASSFCISGIVEDTLKVTHYQIFRDELSIGETIGTTMQDILSSSGTYIYTVTAFWNNGCSASAQKTFTNVAQISSMPNVLDFYANHGFNTAIRKVSIYGSGLSASIQANVTGNFQISNDSVNFANTITLPANGGTLFVKYVSSGVEHENGMVTLTSGGSSAIVTLTGQIHSECPHPQNLILSNANDAVGLSWDDCTSPTDQREEMTWLNDVANIHYGSTVAIERHIVQRFSTTDLAPYHGKQLTAISFIPDSSATTYTLVVFVGGGLNGPSYFTSGTQVINQTVSPASLTNGVWNTIPLNNPVSIDASQELWFGIYVEAPAGSSPIRMATPYVPQKGCIYKSSTTPFNHWTEYHTEEMYCAALKATIQELPITLNHYQVDRMSSTLGTTNATTYTDTVPSVGDYDYAVWAVWSNGCRAAARGSITVIRICPSSEESFTEEGCDSFTWHGESYDTSGTYTYEYTDIDGCFMVDTLHLTIRQSTHNVYDTTACESFTWHDTTYTTSGTYTYAYTNTTGCASVDTLKLTVNYGSHNVYDTTVCESFVWHDTTYTTSGTYTYAYTNTTGCASVDTLKLTVNYGSHNVFDTTACESFVWHDTTYTTSGTYTYAYTNTTGCASVDTLKLTVNYGTHNVYDTTACESFVWHDTTYTTSGTYTYAYTNNTGCASVDTLKLTVNYGTHTVETETACESFVWHDTIYTTSGTYTYAYTNNTGCQSVDTLILTVNYGTHNVETETACESFTWHDTTYTTSGTYTYAYTNSTGCQSVDTLKLTVNYGTHNVETETACESFVWHDTEYTTSGTYTYEYNNDNGCISVDTLHLTVNYSVFESVEVTTTDSCYEWNSEVYCESGDYTQTFQTVNGCDSVVTLHLTITVGIPSAELPSIDVFPIPAHYMLNIKGENMRRIDLLNADGRLVYTIMKPTSNLEQIDVSRFAAGHYFVKVTLDNKQTVTKKVIVNRK